MTSAQLLDLSTRLVKDLKAWSEAATTRTHVSPEDLEALERAAIIIDRVTTAAAAEAQPLPPYDGR